MPFPVRFHVLTLPNRPWPDLRAQVKELERLGFDAAVTGDHFCDWANPSEPWFEAWTLLSALACETSSIRLAPNVAQIPLRNPAVLAHQAVTLDHVSDGRLDLGLGTGLTIDPSTEMVGLPNWSNAERVARFGEYVELVSLLVSQPVTSFTGEYYSANNAVMNPGSLQQPRIPIVVAALGPIMMGHAARHADTWNTMSFDPDFSNQGDELADRNVQMDNLCESIGRDPATLRRSVNLFDAEARAAGGNLRYYDDDELFVELVAGLIEAGYTDIGLYHPNTAHQDEAFARVATEVVPRLKTDG
ncbi:MAG: LLM class flavin-dependent oxidoreductase [Acidimicrobiales bacterium]